MGIMPRLSSNASQEIILVHGFHPMQRTVAQKSKNNENESKCCIEIMIVSVIFGGRWFRSCEVSYVMSSSIVIALVLEVLQGSLLE
jgi:hypothetical protein